MGDPEEAAAWANAPWLPQDAWKQQEMPLTHTRTPTHTHIHSHTQAQVCLVRGLGVPEGTQGLPVLPLVVG